MTGKKLADLSGHLATGYLRIDASEAALCERLGDEAGREAHRLLGRLRDAGASQAAAAEAVRLLAEAHQGFEAAPRPELVWTLPWEDATARPTSHRAETLLASAERDVLVATYSFGHWDASGEEGNPVFAVLRRRMVEVPTLRARLFLGEFRRDRKHPLALLRKRLEGAWPWPERPAVHAPAALYPDGGQATYFHAKALVVDGRHVLFGSANLTEEGVSENFEIGVRHVSEAWAREIAGRFEAGLEAGHFRRLDGW